MMIPFMPGDPKTQRLVDLPSGSAQFEQRN